MHYFDIVLDHVLKCIIDDMNSVLSLIMFLTMTVAGARKLMTLHSS